MKGDFTRFTFDPDKQYAQVLKQQGRVDLDADWNEAGAIQTYLDETRATDIIGRCGAPIDHAGFGVGVTADSSDLTLTAGRMYVDGILCETKGTTYSEQPYYLDPPPIAPENGRFDLVYLDVWRRHITALEDPDLLEKALGGADTTTRLQTIWQVKVRPGVEEQRCDGQFAPWPPLPPLYLRGRLSSHTVVVPDADDPCLINPGGGYRGLENRLYRVEIHDGSDTGQPTFKWSRDNGAVVFAVAEFVAGKPKELIVQRIGRDQVLALHVGDWVEVLDDASELAGMPGTMAQIEEIDEAQRKLILSQAISGYQVGRHAKVRRWDQPSAPIPITAATFDLEDGVQVCFGGGPHITGDYWTFAARTASGDIEVLDDAPPQGIEHHYCRLALIHWQQTEELPQAEGGIRATANDRSLRAEDEAQELELLLAYMRKLDEEEPPVVTEPRRRWQPIIHDCRNLFPPLTALRESCCTVTVGDGVRSHGMFKDIQQAVDHLPAEGGRVCILPGEYILERPILLRGRVNVTLTGCLPHTWLMVRTSKPAIVIRDCLGVRLENLGCHIGFGAVAVAADRTRELYVKGNHIVSRKPENGDRKAVDVQNDAGAVVLERCQQVGVEGNVLETGGLTGVSGLCRRLTVRENLIWGGITLWSGSRDVLVQGNELVEGLWHGVAFRAMLEKDDPRDGTSRGIREKQQAAPLRQMMVRENRISEMAGSGIAVESRPNLDDPISLLATDYLTIQDNEIVGCAGGQMVDDGRSVAGGIVLAGGKHIHITGNLIENCGPAEKPPRPMESLLREEGDHDVPAGAVAGTPSRKLAALDIRTADSRRIVSENRGISHNLHYLRPILEKAEDEESAAPTAGIYIYQSEGLEISHNRILNNGSPRVRQQAAGRQGGIIVRNAAIRPFYLQLDKERTLMLPDGYPAAKIHANTIIVPRGPALQIRGYGDMAISDNQFTSQGAIPVTVIGDDGNEQPGVQLLGVVQIVNVGIADELIGLFQGFLRLVTEQAQRSIASTGAAHATLTNFNLEELSLGGTVLFNDNQVTFNLLRPELELAAGAVTIISLDDVACHDNQMDAMLLSNDYMLANGIIGGLRSRISGNIFKESLGRCYFSCLSLALMNTVTGNQGNHCFGLWGLPQFFVQENNLSLTCQIDRGQFQQYLGEAETQGPEAEAVPELKAAVAYRQVLQEMDRIQPAILEESRAIQAVKIQQLEAEKAVLTRQPEVEETELAALNLELAASQSVKIRLDTLATIRSA